MKLVTIAKAPRLAIAAVKQFEGTDGYGLNADLFLDGKRVAFLLDEGSGGEFMTRYTARETEKVVDDYINSLNLPAKIVPLAEGETDGKQITLEQDLESLVNETCDQMANEKRYKRLLKTSVIWRNGTLAAGEFFVLKHNGKPDETKVRIKKKYNDATFLNETTFRFE